MLQVRSGLNSKENTHNTRSSSRGSLMARLEEEPEPKAKVKHAYFDVSPTPEKSKKHVKMISETKQTVSFRRSAS